LSLVQTTAKCLAASRPWRRNRSANRHVRRPFPRHRRSASARPPPSSASSPPAKHQRQHYYYYYYY